MKIQANTIRAGNVIEHDGKQYTVLKIQILQPGKGSAFIHVEMRDVRSGIKTNERFRTSESVEKLTVNEKRCTMLYAEDNMLNLMDTGSYEQFAVDRELAGEAAVFLSEGMELTVDTVEGAPVGLRLPPTVTLAVTEADAVVKGQTASSSFKPAILENGVKVMVPPHIEAGTRIVVNTAEATYVERAKV